MRGAFPFPRKTWPPSVKRSEAQGAGVSTGLMRAVPLAVADGLPSPRPELAQPVFSEKLIPARFPTD